MPALSIVCVSKVCVRMLEVVINGIVVPIVPDFAADVDVSDKTERY